MGILTTILGRIAIPLGIAVVAGFLIVTFKDRITGAITGGATTLGQIISSPFGSILQGINEGFSNIPQFLDFRLPEFRFAFGDAGFNTNALGQPITPAPAGFVPLTPAQTANFPSNCSIVQDAQGNVTTTCAPATNITPTPQIMGSPAPSSPLTIFQGGSFRVGVTLPSGFSGIRTRQEIIDANPDVIGLFDLINTSKTEFLPLTAQQVQQQQGNLRLSAQLFEEAKNVQEALSFA